MTVGILGGTGPAGRGLGLRLAAAGEDVVIGSRDAGRAQAVVAELLGRWPDRTLALTGAANESAAEADLVVVGTPYDAALSTVRPLAGALAGKVVVSMVVGLLRDRREFLAVLPSRGSMAAALQHALPGSGVAAALHHLPASEMEDLEIRLDADVLLCADEPSATDAAEALVRRIDGLRPVDAGSLSQAAAMESFTALLVTVNVRHKVHASVRLTGLHDGEAR